MSETCTHHCDTCSAGCGQEQQHNHAEPSKYDFLATPNEKAHVSRVIGVMSGKGGVGKSLVTASLAVELRRRGHKVAVLDADITGPSIPKAFGLHGLAGANEFGTEPMETKTGISVISLNLLIENETDPVIWRGPIIADLVRQFWTGVTWGDVDYMLVDLPPGTGDVPLTVFQSLPLDGVVVVTSPQELVSMIVTKATKMVQMLDIPVVGLVENYSMYKCPHCGKMHSVFGESQLEETAATWNLPILDRLPIDPEMAEACDTGTIETFHGGYLTKTADAVERLK
ncbi:MAG: Mrp/NBP35 family ATP-binding protein [Oscillospiraceae bacterium]|nr:Mrp/NBP35 family ATP-binding protein [Oscillospiraceae bacterium]